MPEEISEAERLERRRRVEEARHHSELEGIRTDDDTRAIQDEWVAVRISTEEFTQMMLRHTS